MSRPGITGVPLVARAGLKFSAGAAESKASRPARCRAVLRITSDGAFSCIE
jgi:hypothetical protein